MTAASEDLDIVIVGGGLAGLVLAGQLLKQGVEARIAVIEPYPPETEGAGAGIDLRVSAITPASRAILEDLDIWQHLPPDRVSPYRRMCVWHAEGEAGGKRSISFDAAEVGTPELGYIVENEAIRRALWSSLEPGAVNLLTDAKLTKLARSDEEVSLELDDGRLLNTRLIVGADGARSWVRNQLDVGFRERESGQLAIVGHIATELPHEETAWQRFLPGGPIALLPLTNGTSSFVWSCPTARATQLGEADADEFTSEITNALDHVLGQVECVTPRAFFPLGTGFASQYTGRRFALIGDAAHRVHPLAGLGANLGLLDAAELAQVLTRHMQNPVADPGDPSVLRRYERARKSDNLLTMGTLDAINRLFRHSPIAEVGGLGFDLVDRVPPLKNFLTRYAMGARQGLPAAARLRSV